MSYITPPVQARNLYRQACSSDDVTIDSWGKIWIDQTKENHAAGGPFRDSSIAELFAVNKLKPAIIIGSGPSLKINVSELKDTCGIPKISCLHNFHYLEDNDAPADYYVSLDAGPVTLEEIAEGGTRSIDEYLEISKNRTLCAFVGSSPKLIQSWKGRILWMNSCIPHAETSKAMDAIEKFRVTVSTGGNVLGACLYIAKAIMGSNPIIFTGADFSFGYKKEFHPWDSKYDKDLGAAFKATNVFGIKVYTWQSYYNFKCWFDWVTINVPGQYINATEGGIFGAYDTGNIITLTQRALSDVLEQYRMHENMRNQCENPETDEMKILF